MSDMTRPDTELARQIAPTGTLRASINFGNPVLAARGAGGEPGGVSVALARRLADRLALPVELVLFETAGRSVQAVADGEADIGFFALDPQRAAQLRFAPPYVQIEGAYLVREASALCAGAEVDREGLRVVVGQGSAYDLFLSRELKQAQILRATTSPGVVDEFLRQGADVAAGVRQQLEADARRHAGLRLLPGNFMVIHQAVGIPADRSDLALQGVWAFVEDMKASGFVAEALAHAGVQGARVAPATGNFRPEGALFAAAQG